MFKRDAAHTVMQTGNSERWVTYLSKLYCAVSAMNLLSPTTWARRPSASPAAQRRMGFALPSASCTRQKANLTGAYTAGGRKRPKQNYFSKYHKEQGDFLFSFSFF